MRQRHSSILAAALAAALLASCAGGCRSAPGPAPTPAAPAQPSPPPSSFKPSGAQEGAGKPERFADAGFGFAYRDDERSSMTRFIARHGKPLGIQDKEVKNIHDGVMDRRSTLLYAGMKVEFYNFARRKAWAAPESMLVAIRSAGTGVYLFGIRTGMTRAEVQAALGVPPIQGDRLELASGEGHYATLLFAGDRLGEIVWEYSRE